VNAIARHYNGSFSKEPMTLVEAFFLAKFDTTIRAIECVSEYGDRITFERHDSLWRPVFTNHNHPNQGVLNV
jgi:hypothetical protein